LGATVITTASQKAKQQAAQSQGADLVIDYTKDDFETIIKKNYPTGIRCVFDGIGKKTFLKGLSCLQKKGTMVLYGNAGGEHPDPIPPTLLTKKGSLVLMRPALYDFVETQEIFQVRLAELFSWQQNGTINLNNLTVKSIQKAASIHEALNGRKLVGKAVVQI
jgi:NADPH2:quinone reductase